MTSSSCEIVSKTSVVCFKCPAIALTDIFVSLFCRHSLTPMLFRHWPEQRYLKVTQTHARCFCGVRTCWDCVCATSWNFIKATFLLSISTFHFTDDEYTFTELCQVFHLLDWLLIHHFNFFFFVHSLLPFYFYLTFSCSPLCSCDDFEQNRYFNHLGLLLFCNRRI